MAGSAQAMEDLRRILGERTPLYSKADETVNTSGERESATVRKLLQKVKPKRRR
jgi:XRE family aerobic/anaerobic benzoate catabolism transcriptional regulator